MDSGTLPFAGGQLMMRLFEVRLFLPEEERAVSSFGSLLHGALMERLPKELVEKLHEQDMRPYSQSVSWDRAGGFRPLAHRRRGGRGRRGDRGGFAARRWHIPAAERV